jgi:DNA-binding response OmpR family regulator
LDTIKKHIVIIEDDSSLSKVLTKILQSQGYLVTCFESLSSVENLLETTVDCFILDEHLPSITGHIICILLKSKSKTKLTPVVLMSADTELKYLANLCCADGYLQKPFNNQALTRVINSVLPV